MTRYEEGFEMAKALAVAAVKEVGPISLHGSYRWREQRVIQGCVAAVDGIELPRKHRRRVTNDAVTTGVENRGTR